MFLVVLMRFYVNVFGPEMFLLFLHWQKEGDDYEYWIKKK